MVVSSRDERRPNPNTELQIFQTAIAWPRVPQLITSRTSPNEDCGLFVAAGLYLSLLRTVTRRHGLLASRT